MTSRPSRFSPIQFLRANLTEDSGASSSRAARRSSISCGARSSCGCRRLRPDRDSRLRLRRGTAGDSARARAARRAGTVTAVDRQRRCCARLDSRPNRRAWRTSCSASPTKCSHRRIASTSWSATWSSSGCAARRPGARARLIERIVPGGIGVFQFPYRIEASALVSGSRWLREHVPGANAVVNRLRGQAGSQPFIPTHSYAWRTCSSSSMRPAFRRATSVRRSRGPSSVMLFVESPISRAQTLGGATGRGRRRRERPDRLDVGRGFEHRRRAVLRVADELGPSSCEAVQQRGRGAVAAHALHGRAAGTATEARLDGARIRRGHRLASAS